MMHFNEVQLRINTLMVCHDYNTTINICRQQIQINENKTQIIPCMDFRMHSITLLFNIIKIE